MIPINPDDLEEFTIEKKLQSVEESMKYIVIVVTVIFALTVLIIFTK